MYRFVKYILWLMSILTLFSITTAQVPQEFLPNHNINTNWEEILNTLTELQAYRKTWNPIPEDMFGLLYKDFQSVFPYFPSTPSNNLIYKQCELVTQTLAWWVNDQDYAIFMTKCFDPISNILKDISSNYTIKAMVTAVPKSGNAPLSVTFDASKSEDPSNETIPNDNFYRYFTDTDGITRTIWRGPIVNYTFTKAWSYIVHTTVRSVNNNKWYFDWSVDTQVVVSPSDTKINILANWVKLNKDYPIKLSLQEWVAGITFDATSTIVSNGKKIISHNWNISSADKSYNFTKTLEQTPWQLKLTLPDKWGTYNISLSTRDNTNASSNEVFTLVLSDPVAKIKTSTLDGTTSTNFAFGGDTSYGVSSQIVQYTRELLDETWNKLYTSQEKNIKYNFLNPGIYTVRLTVKNQLNATDTSSKKIIVSSTPPVPWFTITSTNQRMKASEYVLDASNSFDVDELRGNDAVSFQRSFSNNENVKIIDSTGNNKRVVVQFDARWTYKIQLTARDSFGKEATTTRDVNIDTALRPQVEINPVATTRWNEISFKVTSNKPIVNYKRDFGDGITRTTQINQISHVYDKVGIYKATVTVSDKDLDENSITSNVFIWENEKPIWVYSIVTIDNKTILPTEICEDGWWSYDAYSIARYEQIIIDGSKSVDVRWAKNNLDISFKPKNDDLFNVNQLRYKFGELWCQYIDMIVEDGTELSADKKRIWFKVKNWLPIMDNIYLTFPQYSNDVGIWFFQQSPHTDPSFQQFDPLIVKVNLENPRDLDGNLSYIARYYYKADDPNRLLDIKVTPGTNYSVNFAISREAWEYTFGAKIIDNDWWEVRSEDIIWKWPSIFVQPKWTNSVDIPIVTLQTDKVNAKVWEEVTFRTSAKVLSARSDFEANRILKYDFDGDGVDDLTTKDDVVKFIYTSPNEDWRVYSPKVKVLYRDKVWVWYSEKISIQRWLKANFMYFQSNKKIIVRDLTYGKDDNTIIEYCMDDKNCDTTTIRGKNFFEYVYKNYGDYTIKLKVADKYWNVSNFEQNVSIKSPNKMYIVDLMTTPPNKILPDGYELDVGKSLDNQIILDLQYFGTWECYIDVDLVNWDHDKDLSCNQLHKVDVWWPFQTRLMKIWYTNRKWLTSKIIKVNLIDNTNIIPSEYEGVYEHISDMINNYANRSDYIKISEKLAEIKNNLWDKERTTELLIDLAWLTSDVTLDQQTTADFDKLYSALGSEWFRATLWLSEYERLKREITSYTTPTIQSKVEQLFNQVDLEADKTVAYNLLSQILQLFGDEVARNNIVPTDYDVVKSYICQIVNIKEIPNTKCGTTNNLSDDSVSNNTTIDGSAPNANHDGKSFISKLIRRLLIIIGVILVGFIVLVIVFAIKARLNNKATTDNAIVPSDGNSKWWDESWTEK